MWKGIIIITCFFGFIVALLGGVYYLASNEQNVADEIRDKGSRVLISTSKVVVNHHYILHRGRKIACYFMQATIKNSGNRPIVYESSHTFYDPSIFLAKQKDIGVYVSPKGYVFDTSFLPTPTPSEGADVVPAILLLLLGGTLFTFMLALLIRILLARIRREKVRPKALIIIGIVTSISCLPIWIGYKGIVADLYVQDNYKTLVVQQKGACLEIPMKQTITYHYDQREEDNAGNNYTQCYYMLMVPWKNPRTGETQLLESEQYTQSDWDNRINRDKLEVYYDPLNNANYYIKDFSYPDVYKAAPILENESTDFENGPFKFLAFGLGIYFVGKEVLFYGGLIIIFFTFIFRSKNPFYIFQNSHDPGQFITQYDIELRKKVKPLHWDVDFTQESGSKKRATFLVNGKSEEHAYGYTHYKAKNNGILWKCDVHITSYFPIDNIIFYDANDVKELINLYDNCNNTKWHTQHYHLPLDSFIMLFELHDSLPKTLINAFKKEYSPGNEEHIFSDLHDMEQDPEFQLLQSIKAILSNLFYFELEPGIHNSIRYEGSKRFVKEIAGGDFVVASNNHLLTEQLLDSGIQKTIASLRAMTKEMVGLLITPQELKLGMKEPLFDPAQIQMFADIGMELGTHVAIHQ